MPLSPAERIRVLIRCDHCGQATEKFLAGLIGKTTVPCGTPGCGHAIDLQSADNAILVQKLAEQIPSLNAALAKEAGKR